jgi:FkbM family methyltransferase
LEIGAHHGFTGFYLSRFIGDNGHIVSVEANPSNALIDDAQTTLNKFQNLRFVHFAASNKPGKVRISTNHNASVCNNGNSSEVEAITGDLLDSKYGPFNVLKVDVEGYELEVLQGCSQLLNRSPKLAIELHLDDLSKFGHRVEDVWDLINADKYKGEMIVRPARPNNRIPFSISAVKNLKHDANSPYLIVNIFLSR